MKTHTLEHCSANAEATGSNPVEAPKSFFLAFSQLLKLRFTVMVRYSFQHFLQRMALLHTFVWQPFFVPFLSFIVLFVRLIAVFNDKEIPQKWSFAIYTGF